MQTDNAFLIGLMARNLRITGAPQSVRCLFPGTAMVDVFRGLRILPDPSNISGEVCLPFPTAL